MCTDVSLQTSGRSAVFHGAERNYLEIVKLLIQGGADLSLTDKVSTSVFNPSTPFYLHTSVDIFRVKK